MKKLISVALVLCMVLALVPAMAFAAAAPAGAIAMVGEDNYFTDLQAAINAAAAPDAKTNRVDMISDATDIALVISGNVVLQMNGHKLEGKAGVLSVAAPPVTINTGATLTIQGPGKIHAHNSADTSAALGNAGTLILDKSIEIQGAIVNTGSLTVHNASVTGCVVNSGSVTVNGGDFHEDSAKDALFTGEGKVTINGGSFWGNLDVANDSCPGLTVNGGAFTDRHVIKHTTAPVAGVYGLGYTADVNGYELYWVGAASITGYANYYKNLGKKGVTVDFLIGDVKVDGMPTYNDGWLYWDAWDSYYDDDEEKQLEYYIDVNKSTADGAEFACDGRGLVNSRSDLNVVAEKFAVKSTVGGNGDPIANSVLNQNSKYVKSVTSYTTGVNKNEVFVTIEISADLKHLTEFKVPEGFSKYGNYNGTHQWVPITLKFVDLNGFAQTAGTDVEAEKNWTTAFGYYTNGDSNFHIWVGLDHYIQGDNSSLDFVDLRYDNLGHGHALIYRCTIVVKDVNVDVPENSEPDDTTGAAPIPSGSGSATPSATTAPAGTGAGDGPARTGDNSTVMLWATLLIASAAGVAICVVDEAKKRSHK